MSPYLNTTLVCKDVMSITSESYCSTVHDPTFPHSGLVSSTVMVEALCVMSSEVGMILV